MTIPVPYLDLVSVGSDDQLSRDSCYWFSIKKFSEASPRSLKEAAVAVIEIMPRWMNIALQNARGDYECLVSVNDRDFVSVLVGAQVEFWRARGVRMANWVPGEDDNQKVIDALDDEICRQIRR